MQLRLPLGAFDNRPVFAAQAALLHEVELDVVDGDRSSGVACALEEMLEDGNPRLRAFRRALDAKLMPAPRDRDVEFGLSTCRRLASSAPVTFARSSLSASVSNVRPSLRCCCVVSRDESRPPSASSTLQRFCQCF